MDKIFNFKTTLKRPEGVGTWHYVDTPLQVEKEFSTKGKIPIGGKVNGTEFSSTLIPRGKGEHYIVLDKAIREKAGIQIGDVIEMEIWKDNSKREVLIPDAFQESLSKNQSANDFFTCLAYSYQKAYVDWINDAKKEVTKKNRIEKSINLLKEHRKLR